MNGGYVIPVEPDFENDLEDEEEGEDKNEEEGYWFFVWTLNCLEAVQEPFIRFTVSKIF